MCLQHKELMSLAVQIAVRMLNIDAVDGDNEESCLLGYNEMLCGGNRFIPNVCKATWRHISLDRIPQIVDSLWSPST